MNDTSKEAMLALSIRFHDQVSNIFDALEDEGDRVYLGSTNDADTLRDIAQTVQAIQWEKDEPPVDWHKRVQELLSERDALRKAVDSYSYIGRDGKMVLAKDLEDERDALRAQLQAARDDALEEGIEHACAVIDAFSEYDQNECCDGRECGCYGTSVHDHMKHQIRALKSTSAEGEG